MARFLPVGLLVGVLLATGARVRAEDDDEMLETPAVPSISDRMQDLEREWSEDVGTKDTEKDADVEPAPLDEAHDAARGVDEAPDVGAPAAAQPASPKRPSSSAALQSPIRRTAPERAAVRDATPPATKDGAAAPARPPASAATSSEE